jgi:hypothetical protein
MENRDTPPVAIPVDNELPPDVVIAHAAFVDADGSVVQIAEPGIVVLIGERELNTQVRAGCISIVFMLGCLLTTLGLVRDGISLGTNEDALGRDIRDNQRHNTTETDEYNDLLRQFKIAKGDSSENKILQITFACLTFVFILNIARVLTRPIRHVPRSAVVSPLEPGNILGGNNSKKRYIMVLFDRNKDYKLADVVNLGDLTEQDLPKTLKEKGLALFEIDPEESKADLKKQINESLKKLPSGVKLVDQKSFSANVQKIGGGRRRKRSSMKKKKYSRKNKNGKSKRVRK